MIRKLRPLSKLSVIAIVAVVLSSSFCLRLLVGVALATEIKPVVKSSQMKITVVSNCLDAQPIPASPDQQISQEQPMASTPTCCLDQNHNSNAIASYGFSADNLLLVALPVTSQVISVPLVNFNNQIVFLPPLQTDSLRAIVKRE